MRSEESVKGPKKVRGKKTPKAKVRRGQVKEKTSKK
jgi:hypothetical protein